MLLAPPAWLSYNAPPYAPFRLRAYARLLAQVTDITLHTPRAFHHACALRTVRTFAAQAFCLVPSAGRCAYL